MLTAKEHKALSILAEHPYPEGVTASRFAVLYFNEEKHRILFTAVSNQGNGACAGKKSWLCAGSFLGRLAKKGYCFHRYKGDVGYYYISPEGEKAIKKDN